MPDYAAAPVQPLVQGLVTIVPGVPPTLVFDGKGIIETGVFRPHYTSAGRYILFFDPGLPGNAGAVEAIPELPLVAPADPNVRTSIMPIGVGVPPVSGIFAIGVFYLASLAVGVGVTGINIVMTTGPVFTPVDPSGGAFEITVWKGLGGGPVPPP